MKGGRGFFWVPVIGTLAHNNTRSIPNLFTLLSSVRQQPAFASISLKHKAATVHSLRDFKLPTTGIIYSFNLLYFCTRQWEATPNLRGSRRLDINIPSVTGGICLVFLLRSFFDTGAHILFWWRSSCWRVVKQSNQLSTPPTPPAFWPEGPGTELWLQALRTAERWKPRVTVTVRGVN